MKFSLYLTDKNTSLAIRFKHASQGVGSLSPGPGWATLQPGECAWLDRPVSANEPEVIIHNVDRTIPITLSWEADNSGPGTYEFRLGGATMPPACPLIQRYPSILRLLPGTAGFQVYYVYNDGHYLVVTRAD